MRVVCTISEVIIRISTNYVETTIIQVFPTYNTTKKECF